MDGIGDMTTEVQITKNRWHLLYLRKVMLIMASRLGMPRKAVAETHHAVTDICSESDGMLCIRLSASEVYLVVEVAGTALPEQISLRRISRLVDDVEFANGVIRLTKFVKRIETAAYSPALGTE